MDYHIRLADTTIQIQLPDGCCYGKEFEDFIHDPVPGEPIGGKISYDQNALPHGNIAFWSPELMIHKDKEKTSLVYSLSNEGIKGVYHCAVRNTEWNDFIACRLPDIDGYKGLSAGWVDAVSFQPACRYLLLWQDALIVHASAVVLNGRAYLFLAPSGTGKSTHADLWLKNFRGAFKLNDDQPIIRYIGGKWRAYGSIWSGSEPIYRNEGYELDGMCILAQSPDNSIRKLEPLQSFIALTGQVPLLEFEDRLNGKTIELMSALCEKIPCYYLFCRPDNEAAQISKAAMTMQR